jgi:23S rRNA (cytidine1920-2'-O)/16S rRNA (cytidine1409-2'-O)-methyltransferase
MPKRRLDTLLAERGLFESRSRAAAAVIAGDVQLGGHGERASKPGQMVTDDVAVALAQRPPFVSRGGVKLRNALDALGVEVAGRHCLDAGASTGGFTDCLLQRGAAGVIALDVAYGELDLGLREDPRVDVVERTNARSIDSASLPWRADLLVADLSFISLRKALPGILSAAAPERFDCLALVKPQFEVGRERVGRGGVVREPAARRDALVTVGRCAREELGHAVMGYASSGLPGPSGNRETFVWIAEASRAGAVGDLEAAAREVEP